MDIEWRGPWITSSNRRDMPAHAFVRQQGGNPGINHQL